MSSRNGRKRSNNQERKPGKKAKVVKNSNGSKLEAFCQSDTDDEQSGPKTSPVLGAVGKIYSGNYEDISSDEQVEDEKVPTAVEKYYPQCEDISSADEEEAELPKEKENYWEYDGIEADDEFENAVENVVEEADDDDSESENDEQVDEENPNVKYGNFLDISDNEVYCGDAGTPWSLSHISDKLDMTDLVFYSDVDEPTCPSPIITSDFRFSDSAILLSPTGEDDDNNNELPICETLRLPEYERNLFDYFYARGNKEN